MPRGYGQSKIWADRTGTSQPQGASYLDTEARRQRCQVSATIQRLAKNVDMSWEGQLEKTLHCSAGFGSFSSAAPIVTLNLQ
jgi:hypothetical protein